jgi:transcriptional regulator with XRE-family HTH domain
MGQPSDPPDIPDGPIRINGEQLDFAIRAAGWSHAEFAERTREPDRPPLSAGYVSKVINGHSRVSVATMARILKVFRNRLRFDELAVVDEPEKGRAPR